MLHLLSVSVFIPSSQVKVEWSSPARPNGEIVSYTVHHKDPVQLDITSTLIAPDESDFSARVTTLHGLAAYHRSATAVHGTLWSVGLTPDLL